MSSTNNRAETLGDVASRAAQGGDLGDVLALLEQGFDPDAPDRHGFTFLARAAQYDRLDLMRLLLDAGADPNAPCRWGLTPLMMVKSAEVAEALLAAGAEVNAVTQFNRSGMEPAKTALMKAAQGGRLAIVELLLAHGADTEMRDSEGRSALIDAAASGHAEVARVLVEAGARVGLVEAAALGDSTTVKAFLSAGADLDGDLTGSALWWAAGNGQAEAVRLLLDGGADVNARVGRSVTALIQAALMGRTEVVKTLLARGADVNAYDGRGAMALHASLVSTVHGCKVDVVRALLAAGAQVKARTQFSWPTHTGGTALMEAALHGATDCARALIEYGADVEAVSDIDEDGVGGWTALLAAVANNRLDTTRLLIESGADVNNSGKDGRPPLTLARSRARRTGNTEIIDLLVTAGADGGGDAT